MQARKTANVTKLERQIRKADESGAIIPKTRAIIRGHARKQADFALALLHSEKPDTRALTPEGLAVFYLGWELAAEEIWRGEPHDKPVTQETWFWHYGSALVMVKDGIREVNESCLDNALGFDPSRNVRAC